jgi:hypothetical protein
MMRAKDAAARIPSTVPGMTSTNRVYDPVWPLNQVDSGQQKVQA